MNNPFFHIDDQHNARILGIKGEGWAAIWLVLSLPVAFGFFVLMFWNLSVRVLLKYAGYIPYPVTGHYCNQAAIAFVSCAFLIPIPVVFWALRQDTKNKLRQIAEHKQYLDKKLAALRQRESEHVEQQGTDSGARSE